MISQKTEQEFLSNETLGYALAHKLTVVREAAGRLTPEVRARNGRIPWSDIVGLRNILVHEYFGIHWPLVWQTAVDDVPVLRAQIAEVIRREFPD